MVLRQKSSNQESTLDDVDLSLGASRVDSVAQQYGIPDSYFKMHSWPHLLVV